MACGCNNPCGCIVVGDNETVDVTSVGTDTFVVSARQVISGVADTDCMRLDVDPDTHVLTAVPMFSLDQTSIELACTEDGIRAAVVIDPASTAIVSASGDGLRVDIPPPAPAAGAGQPGDLIFYSGVGIRSDAIDADGQPVSRAYSALHDAVSLFAIAANRSNGAPQINGIPSTRFMAPGMPLEATGFPSGTTVLTVDSSTAITASANATTTGSDTLVRVYPHGDGDGATTFNTPNLSDRYPLGYDYQTGLINLGEAGGAGSVTLTEPNMPIQSHTAHVTDPGHNHSAVVNDPGHAHIPGTASRSFVTAETATLTTVNLQDTGDGDLIVQAGESGPPRQRNNASTSSQTTGITVGNTPSATGISVTVDNTGHASPTPIAVNPPHFVGRWMVVV